MFKCEKCGNDLDYDYEPEYCCNSFDCGCGGKPNNPPLCSKCFKEYLYKIDGIGDELGDDK